MDLLVPLPHTGIQSSFTIKEAGVQGLPQFLSASGAARGGSLAPAGAAEGGFGGLTYM